MDSPNTRNSARLRSPSPIMAPGKMYQLTGKNYTSGLISSTPCFGFFRATIQTTTQMYSTTVKNKKEN